MTEAQRVEKYSAQDITVLKGLEGVRLRPAMYIGDTGIKGFHHLLHEVVDNAVDEALAGYCTHIKVTLHRDGSASVEDNGRGIPVDIHPEEGRPALEVVMTSLHAGAKFTRNVYKVSGGLHGVGVSCVNALSEWLEVHVYRDGKEYMQRYERGNPTMPVTEVGETTKRGTLVRFKPDREIFGNLSFNRDLIGGRLRTIAYLLPGLRLTLIDEREEEEPREETYYSERGIVDMIAALDRSKNPLLPQPIYIKGTRDDIEVEVAFEYTQADTETLLSYVNLIDTTEGGPHVTGFRRALTRIIKNIAEREGWLQKTKIDLTGEDFKEGLTAVISVKLPNPQFSGQTKTKLANPEAGTAVESITSEQLSTYLEENPQVARTIFERVVLTAQARLAAKKARELVQRKTPLVRGGLPGKLADCTSTRPQECELFIVEGDSAGGTAKQARDRRFQAVLPIRGKILNVEKASEHKIMENEEIKNILTALGITPLYDIEDYENAKLRYHKIIIMTDADVDGAHIATLLLTFFYRKARPLIEMGHVYLAQPPLYLVQKGKRRIYCWSEEERNKAIEELQKSPERGEITVQRYKGLGEMNAEQLWETTMNPETRVLKKVTIEDAAAADQTFTMLMGTEVAPRRKFIETYARFAEVDV